MAKTTSAPSVATTLESAVVDAWDALGLPELTCSGPVPFDVSDDEILNYFAAAAARMDRSLSYAAGIPAWVRLVAFEFAAAVAADVVSDDPDLADDMSVNLRS